MPAFILLSALGLAFVRVQRFEISAFLAGIVYFVATVTYGSPNIAGTVDGRFYMPIFFLLVALAVLPADWAVAQALKGCFSIWSVGVLAVFLFSSIGYPSQSGFKPRAVDHRLGTLFITQTAMENHSGTRRRRNSFASSETLLALFYRISSPPI